MTRRRITAAVALVAVLSALVVIALEARAPVGRYFLHNGQRLVTLGRPRTALTDFSLAIAATPARPEPWLARAQAWRALDEPARAAADLAQARRRAPQRADLAFRHGVVLAHALDNHSAAVRAYDAALRQTPRDPQIHYQRAHSLDRLNNSAAALAGYSRALALDPALTKAYLGRAVLHHRLRHYAAEARDLSSALRLTPQPPEVHMRRGEAYLRLARYDLALADFDTAVRRAPSAARLFKRGTALLHLQRFAEAVRAFSAALRHNPYSLAARYNRAQAHAALGRHAAARRDWRLVCELEAAGQSDACIHARQPDRSAPRTAPPGRTHDDAGGY